MLPVILLKTEDIIMKKIMSVFLALIMLFSAVSALPAEAFAAAKTASVSSITAYNKELVVNIKKAKGTAGYQIQYAFNKKFKKAKTVTTKKTVVRLMKLKNKKKYFVRVRSYKKSGKKKKYSKWSKAKSAKTNSRLDDRYVKLLGEIYASGLYILREGSVSKAAWDYIGYNEFDEANSEYTLVDLDSNGIDELIISAFGTPSQLNAVYTLNKGRLSLVTAYSGSPYASLKGKVICTYGGVGATSNTTYEKLKKNSDKLKTVCTAYSSNGDYKLNGKSVSESEYTKKRNKYENAKLPKGWKKVSAVAVNSSAKSKPGKVAGVSVKLYVVNEKTNESAPLYMFDFPKVKGADGYQFAYGWSGDETYYSQTSGNKGKLYFVFSPEPSYINIRAYKYTAKGVVYGEWSSLFSTEGIDRNSLYKGSVVSKTFGGTSFDNTIKGYNKIL